MVFKYDVALSFAGEDRAYVATLANELRDLGVQVFYDEFETVSLWGSNLYEQLDLVYREQSRYAVIFASEHYARKIWTNHERRSLQARALEEKGSYLLPVRLDDSEIPGVWPTIGFIDGRVRAPIDIAKLIVSKLREDGSALSAKHGEEVLLGVPLTEADTQRVISLRPRGWEYLLLAGGIWQAVSGQHVKLLDHELGYARSDGSYVAPEQVPRFVMEMNHLMQHLLAKLMALVRADTQVWALGAPGEPGDPVRIVHLTQRFGAVFEEMLDWSATLRATPTSPEFFQALQMLANFTNVPVREIVEFAETMVSQTSRIPEHFASGSTETLGITVELTLTGDDVLTESFAQELDRAVAEYVRNA